MVASALPPSEHVHWWFASGWLLVALCLLARAVVGPEVWDRRRWRRYLLPSLFFTLGLLLFPVMVLFTSSTIHILAHGIWAQAVMLAGAATLGMASGKLKSPLWGLTVPLAFAVSGAAFLAHEQNPWLFSRAAFIHHLSGWVLVIGAIVPLVLVFRPRSGVFNVLFATSFIVISILLFADRDTAPVFGHLSPDAGIAKR
jgi:hypothetical protein